ncbi:MAG TPA: glycoside hydrolase [Clostridia bacterium]|nr:glycoside hydrolase [Clostridia bacterium]
MHRRQFLQAVSLAALAPAMTWAANPSPEKQEAQLKRWIKIAEGLKPKLHETTKFPVSIVKPTADSTRFLRWRMDQASPASALRERLMRDGDSVILDFEDHLTGHLTFSITGEGRGIDSPVRLRLTFGEVPAEVAVPLDQYKGGLSRAWLQDEVINIDVLPATIRLPRRYAFRYVKIDVIATSPNFAVRLDNIKSTALTSAGKNKNPLPPGVPESLRRIDEVSLATLRDCMLTVFEDGPKRDRRLWIGDLRLQALTNYATFQNFDLVKRCLYLFAGLPREDGFVAACVFEDPKPLRGHEYIIDYAALYAATVLDYARASKDWRTARDLWPVVRRQMEILGQYVGPDGLFAAPPGSWVFIDWQDALDRTAAMHGVFVYSLRQAMELANAVGARDAAAEYSQRIQQMTAAGRRAFYDGSQRVFVSGPKRQVSWATQAWMALSEIATQAEGATALRAVREMADAVRPGGPYLYHYFVEAMLQCGLKDDARNLIQTYWGGMVKDGADTFWEVYDPANPMLSPYGDPLANSYCHAWSCTPAYLLRNGGLV